MNQRDWRLWARRYTAAAMLTLGQLSVPIAGHLRTRPAIVRLIERRGRGRFDAREVVASNVVLTVPLAVNDRAERTSSEREAFPLN